MILYIGRLPAEITLSALRQALPIPRHEPWRLRLCKRPLRNGTVARYALYQPPSEEAARRLLRKGRIRIAGETFGVREFLPRRLNNERRRPLGQRNEWKGVERRRGDRRGSRELRSAAA